MTIREAEKEKVKREIKAEEWGDPAVKMGKVAVRKKESLLSRKKPQIGANPNFAMDRFA